MNDRATFTRMDRSTAQDWQAITGEFKPFSQRLPDRILAHLKLLDGDYGGFPVDRYQHSLQTATRALRDGRDEEYVVCALLHDIGDTLGCYNHPDVAAAILKPFVSEANLWMVQNHGIFQGYNFFHHISAVYYLLAEEFDGDPFLIFKLRGRTKDQIIEALRALRSAGDDEEAANSPDPVASVHFKEKNLEDSLDCFWQKKAAADHLELDLKGPKVENSVLKRLGDSPLT